MAVNYDRNGITGAATVSCAVCGCLVALDDEQADDDGLEFFVHEHRNCATSREREASTTDLAAVNAPHRLVTHSARLWPTRRRRVQ